VNIQTVTMYAVQCEDYNCDNQHEAFYTEYGAARDAVSNGWKVAIVEGQKMTLCPICYHELQCAGFIEQTLTPTLGSD